MKKYLLMSCALLFAIPAFASTEELIDNVKSKNIGAVRTLLQNGENVNGINEQGNTALHYAVASNDVEMVNLLLANGADMDIANAKGWTPLKIAEKKNVGEVYSALEAKIVAKKAAAAEKEKAVKEAQKRIAAEKAALMQKAPKTESKKTVSAKTVKNSDTKAGTGTNTKKVIPLKKTSGTKQKVSPLSDKIFEGDEEVVYCLQYLGMQGEQKNMTVAAGFYAMETGVNKERHDEIAAEAKKYYENASADNIKARADLCGQYITPKQAAKQNQIIRSINKSIGI